MSDIIYKGYDITIEIDDNYESPRECDNIGEIITYTRRYKIGDSFCKTGEEIIDILYEKSGCTFNDSESYKDRVLKELEKTHIFLPVYMYEHSGITINTSGFSCGWDSGQIGYIVVSKESIRKEYNVKRISPKLKNKVLRVLRGEIETYDQYLRGEVYYYKVHKNDNFIDSCGGFYGDSDYCLFEAKRTVDYTVKENRKRKCNKLKQLIKNKVSLALRPYLLERAI